MEKKSLEDFGIVVEPGTNNDVTAESVGSESDSAQRDSILLFPKFGVSPERDDQLDAVSTDPTAMLQGLKEANITIEAIPRDEREKFGLEPHPLHTEHLKQAA